MTAATSDSAVFKALTALLSSGHSACDVSTVTSRSGKFKRDNPHNGLLHCSEHTTFFGVWHDACDVIPFTD